MESVLYNCKFCRAEGVVQFDRPAESVIDVDMWLKNIACNPCAKYHSQRRQIEDLLTERATHYYRLQIGNLEIKSQAMQQIRVVMEKLVAKYADLVCSHFGKQTVMDDDFLQQIIDHPMKVHVILGTYRNFVSRL